MMAQKNSDEIFVGVEYVTSTSWLDFGNDAVMVHILSSIFED